MINDAEYSSIQHRPTCSKHAVWYDESCNVNWAFSWPHRRMDWLALLGETGACTLLLLCVLAVSPRLLVTSLEERPPAMPASTQQRSWACRSQSDFGIRLVWAQTRMRLPSSAVVPSRSSMAVLWLSQFDLKYWTCWSCNAMQAW